MAVRPDHRQAGKNGQPGYPACARCRPCDPRGRTFGTCLADRMGRPRATPAARGFYTNRKAAAPTDDPHLFPPRTIVTPPRHFDPFTTDRHGDFLLTDAV